MIAIRRAAQSAARRTRCSPHNAPRINDFVEIHLHDVRFTPPHNVSSPGVYIGGPIEVSGFGPSFGPHLPAHAVVTKGARWRYRCDKKTVSS